MTVKELRIELDKYDGCDDLEVVFEHYDSSFSASPICDSIFKSEISYIEDITKPVIDTLKYNQNYWTKKVIKLSRF